MPFDGRTSGSEVHGCRSLWHCGPSLGFQVSFCVAFQTDVSRNPLDVDEVRRTNNCKNSPDGTARGVCLSSWTLGKALFCTSCILWLLRMRCALANDMIWCVLLWQECGRLHAVHAGRVPASVPGGSVPTGHCQAHSDRPWENRRGRHGAVDDHAVSSRLQSWQFTTSHSLLQWHVQLHLDRRWTHQSGRLHLAVSMCNIHCVKNDTKDVNFLRDIDDKTY